MIFRRHYARADMAALQRIACEPRPCWSGRVEARENGRLVGLSVRCALAGGALDVRRWAGAASAGAWV
jgi:hypothetical protein